MYFSIFFNQWLDCGTCYFLILQLISPLSGVNLVIPAHFPIVLLERDINFLRILIYGQLGLFNTQYELTSLSAVVLPMGDTHAHIEGPLQGHK